MIREYTKNDTSKILHVINNAALRYKGVIPNDCWHEPYMSEKELVDEFYDGVRMFGYQHNLWKFIKKEKILFFKRI